MAEKFSDRKVQCGFCNSNEAYMHTADMKHCWQVISTCRKCRKKAEELDGFIRWMDVNSKT
jgi:hypothetical protein